MLPHSKRIFGALAASGVPRIHFGVGTGELLGLMGEAGAEVVGVDWRVPLDEAVRRVEPGKALQGNLDPAILLAPWEVIEQRARDVLERGRTAEGHIFNLGHGVLPRDRPRRTRPADRPGAHRISRRPALVGSRSEGDGRRPACSARSERLLRDWCRGGSAPQPPSAVRDAADQRGDHGKRKHHAECGEQPGDRQPERAPAS